MLRYYYIVELGIYYYQVQSRQTAPLFVSACYLRCNSSAMTVFCSPRPCPRSCGGTGRCRWSPMVWPSSSRLLGRLGRRRRSGGVCGCPASYGARSSCGAISAPRRLSQPPGWGRRPQSSPAVPSAAVHLPFLPALWPAMCPRPAGAGSTPGAGRNTSSHMKTIRIVQR